jgi:hypothetical protein
MKTSRSSAAIVAAAVGAVSLVTAATSAGLVSVTALAATPRATADGKIWLLFSSAFVADKPAWVELTAFATFAVLVLFLVGPFVLWSSAILGHVGSTLVLYGFIAVAGLVVPAAFDSVLSFEDYGTSAMIAAWVGVIAAVGWRRWGGVGARLGVVAFCAIAASIAWAVHPGASILDGEHVVAFMVGVATAQEAVRRGVRRVFGTWWRAVGAARAAAALRRQPAQAFCDTDG